MGGLSCGCHRWLIVCSIHVVVERRLGSYNRLLHEFTLGRGIEASKLAAAAFWALGGSGGKSQNIESHVVRQLERQALLCRSPRVT